MSNVTRLRASPRDTSISPMGARSAPLARGVRHCARVLRNPDGGEHGA
jgi:hypothetical protein